MPKQTSGHLYTRGKKKHYYVQYRLNGQTFKKALRDEDGKPITQKGKAQAAADRLLAPYNARDEVQRRQQAVDALKTARVKALDAERKKNAVSLPDAFDLAIAKPRRRPLGDKARQQKQTHWNDFVAYMAAEHPEVVTLNDVQPIHAQEYIQYITHNGKFNKEISFKKKDPTATYESKITRLSPRSINCYLTSCRDVFSCLKHASRLEDNPFMEVHKVQLVQEEREAFTEEDLKLISEKADEFIRAIFIIGLSTGLREADICLLKWSEVDIEAELIKRVTRKTRKEVTIPILPLLMGFLLEQQDKELDGEYVLPDHAQMYLSNPSGISWRVKSFLESIGITTTKKPEGRTRAVSIKDVHSLRHSFCYYAGVNNIPLSIVQSVVGHMSPEMTRHYTMHADGNDIKRAFKNMPNLLASNGGTVVKLPAPEEPERQQLRELADVLSIKDIREVLKFIQSK